MKSQAVAVALLVLAPLAGCAPARPTTIAFPGAHARAASSAEWIASYDDVTGTIAAVFTKDLGFPPFTATIQLLPDRGAFEAALLSTGYDPKLAEQTATTMAAIGGQRSVLVNEQKLVSLTWIDRLALLAHELTHTFQYELGGGVRGASDQWLREGFAEWVAMRVLDRVGATTAPAYRRLKQRAVRSAGRANVPRLEEMVTFRQFVAVAERRHSLPYAQAFVAVDLLIQRHGAAAVVRYFELFAASADRSGNFRKAFGEDVATFEEDLLRRVWR